MGYIGVITHLLTIDPNFLGHPSSEFGKNLGELNHRSNSQVVCKKNAPTLEVCLIRIFCSNWVFPKIGVPQNGWFIMENPIKMDVLGEHLQSCGGGRTYQKRWAK